MIRTFFVSLIALFVFHVPSACAHQTLSDINGDGTVGLEEAVYALQVAAGIKHQKDYRQEMLNFVKNISSYAKRNGDGNVGLEEAGHTQLSLSLMNNERIIL